MKVLIELGFDIGEFFGIFENIQKNLVFKKLHYFWVWRLFVVDYCDFGELGVYMGLEFDIVWFVFCLRLKFGLFSVVRNVLKPPLCIVVPRKRRAQRENAAFALKKAYGRKRDTSAVFAKGNSQCVLSHASLSSTRTTELFKRNEVSRYQTCP